MTGNLIFVYLISLSETFSFLYLSCLNKLIIITLIKNLHSSFILISWPNKYLSQWVQYNTYFRLFLVNVTVKKCICKKCICKKLYLQKIYLQKNIFAKNVSVKKCICKKCISKKCICKNNCTFTCLGENIALI